MHFTKFHADTLLACSIPETCSLSQSLQVLISRQPPELPATSWTQRFSFHSSLSRLWPKEVIYAILKKGSEMTALYLVFHKATQEIYEKSIPVAAEL